MMRGGVSLRETPPYIYFCRSPHREQPGSLSARGYSGINGAGAGAIDFHVSLPVFKHDCSGHRDRLPDVIGIYQVHRAARYIEGTGIVLETPDVTVTTEPLPLGRKVLRPVGGAEISPRAYRVDLDMFGEQSPDVSLVEPGDSIRHDPLSFSLERNGVEQILLRVQSQRPGLYSWKARLPILIDGKRDYVDVDDGGVPFRLAGGDLRDTSVWDGDSWVPREL